MNLNKYLSVSPEVQEALAANRPVVALESTIISHGMPYPQNVETALNVEKIIRETVRFPRPSRSSRERSPWAAPRNRLSISAKRAWP